MIHAIKKFFLNKKSQNTATSLHEDEKKKKLYNCFLFKVLRKVFKYNL